MPPLDTERPDPPGTERCDARRWRRFVFGLRDADAGPIRAALAGGGFWREADGVLRIGFGTRFQRSQRQAERLLDAPALLAALAAEFGRGIRLEVAADPTGASGRCLEEELDRHRSGQRAARDAAARSHPLIRATIERFGGTLERVVIPDVLDPEALD